MTASVALKCVGPANGAGMAGAVRDAYAAFASFDLPLKIQVTRTKNSGT